MELFTPGMTAPDKKLLAKKVQSITKRNPEGLKNKGDVELAEPTLDSVDEAAPQTTPTADIPSSQVQCSGLCESCCAKRPILDLVPDCKYSKVSM